MNTAPKKFKNRFYVLYKGDSIVTSGTIDEINQKTDLSIKSLIYMTHPSVRKRGEKGKRKLILIEGGKRNEN